MIETAILRVEIREQARDDNRRVEPVMLKPLPVAEGHNSRNTRNRILFLILTKGS